MGADSTGYITTQFWLWPALLPWLMHLFFPIVCQNKNMHHTHGLQLAFLEEIINELHLEMLYIMWLWFSLRVLLRNFLSHRESEVSELPVVERDAYHQSMHLSPTTSHHDLNMMPPHCIPVHLFFCAPSSIFKVVQQEDKRNKLASLTKIVLQNPLDSGWMWCEMNSYCLQIHF